MTRILLIAVLSVVASTSALAHFVFIVPDADGARAALFLF